MVIHHQPKFGWKRMISSYIYIYIYIYITGTVIFWLCRFFISPYCVLDLKDSNPIFLHETPAHNDAPPYQVWLQKLSSSKDIFWTKLCSDAQTYRQRLRERVRDRYIYMGTVIPVYAPLLHYGGNNNSLYSLLDPSNTSNNKFQTP